MGLYVGSKKINDLYVGGKKVVGAYLGKKKVRPADVVETYTVTRGNTIDIAKTGYKIKQIKTSYTSTTSSTSQYMSSSVVLKDPTGGYSLCIPYNYISYNITYNKKLLVLYCQYNGTQTDEYTTPGLIPVTGPFALEFTTTIDSVQCICNGNIILDQKATTKWKQTAEYLFGLSSVNAQYYLGGATSYYTGSNEAVIEVTYTKL